MKKKKCNKPKAKITKSTKVKDMKDLFAFGGTVESPYTALAEDQINRAKAQLQANSGLTNFLDVFGSLTMQAGSSLISKGIGSASTGEEGKFAKFLADNSDFFNSLLGSTISNIFATGGIADNLIEAEGGEIVETPGGEPVELEGPSHEQGGIDLVVPNFTEIYSDRLVGPDGKTMADRKKKRENKVKKLEKILKDNPQDTTAKKTLDKVIADNARQEEEDLALMEQARQMQEGLAFALGGIVKGGKYKSGGIVGTNPVLPDWMSQLAAATENYDFNSGNTYSTVDLGLGDYTPPEGAITYESSNETNNESSSIFSDLNFKDILPGITLGDAIGFIGTYKAMNDQMKNTLANRAGSTPNINAYKDFGKDALNTIQSSKDQLRQITDISRQDMNRARNSALRRGRNSARSVNTARALDLATDMAISEQQDKLTQQYLQTLLGLTTQEAGLQNQRDQMVMQGEQARDLADRQDRSAFFTNLGRDIANRNVGIQKIGADLNTIKSRNTTEKLLNTMYSDFNFDSMSGEVKAIAQDHVRENISAYEKLDPKLRNKALMNVTVNKTWEIKDGHFYEISTGKVIDPITGEPMEDIRIAESVDIPSSLDIRRIPGSSDFLPFN